MILIMQRENWVHDGIETLSVPNTVEAALAAEVEDEASEDSVSAGEESSERVTDDELDPGSSLREPGIKDIINRHGTF